MANSALKEINLWLSDNENRKVYGSENIKFDLALAIANERKRRGFTQQQVAAHAGVSQAYIAKLESGQANPTIGHIGGILGALWLRMAFTFEPLVASAEISQQKSRLSTKGIPSAFEDRVLTSLAAPAGTADSHTFPLGDRKSYLGSAVVGGIRA